MAIIVLSISIFSCNNEYCDVQKSKYDALKQDWNYYDQLIDAKIKQLKNTDCSNDQPTCIELSEEMVDLKLQQVIIEIDMENIVKSQSCSFTNN